MVVKREQMSTRISYIVAAVCDLAAIVQIIGRSFRYIDTRETDDGWFAFGRVKNKNCNEFEVQFRHNA